MIDVHDTKQAVITFDDQGDLRLEVGENAARRSFIICSRALARVSKPFKAMLYGDFAESKSRIKGPNWTVELPEDNPQAFTTILHIVHSQFGMVPEIVTRETLHQITILTNKYDMTESLRPWARTWLSHVYSADSTLQGDEVLSWIAWELGDRSLFQNKMQWMLYDCHLNGDSKLCCPDGRPLQDDVYIASLDILGMFSSPMAVCFLSSISCLHETVKHFVISMGKPLKGKRVSDDKF